MQLWVIIAAAGASSRFQAAARAQGADDHSRSKLDLELGARPVLQRTVELFCNRADVAGIVVAGPHEPGEFDAFKARYADKLGLLGVRLVRGGRAHRYETVQAALAHVPASATHVAVHDGARPCTPPELIDRLLEAAQRHGAVIPGVPVADTLKRRGQPVTEDHADPLSAILGDAPGAGGPSLHEVGGTVDRAGLVAVQTPQVFEASLLRRAYEQADLASTDDAQLVERLGERVVLVEGDARNVKITQPQDLVLARAILGVREAEGRAAHKRF